MYFPLYWSPLGRGEEPRPRGGAYEDPEIGAIFAVDPAGEAAREPSRTSALLAGGLSIKDCRALEELHRRWEAACGSTPDAMRGARQAQAAYLSGIAAERARSRASLLRAARKGQQPPGSVSLMTGGTLLLRFPDGTGWGIYPGGSRRSRGWPWGPGYPVPEVLSAGLDARQCERLSTAETLEGVRAVLREEGKL